ncbi:tyrosine-type recombinase/integrase, partial [Streptomyces anulatus]
MVTRLGYEHLRRHGLRHTALTWLADAWVQVHVLRRIAGHGSLTTTQRYLHPDIHKITAAGAALSAHFSALPSPIVMTRWPTAPVKDAGPPTGPQLVPKNDQGPVSDCSETGPDLR